MTAPSVANVQAAIEHIYPKVFEYQKKKELEDIEANGPAAKRKLGHRDLYGFKKIQKPNIREESDSDDY